MLRRIYHWFVLARAVFHVVQATDVASRLPLSVARLSRLSIRLALLRHTMYAPRHVQKLVSKLQCPP